MEVESQAQGCCLLISINLPAPRANLLNPKHENSIDKCVRGSSFSRRLNLFVDDLDGKVLVLHLYDAQLPHAGRVFEQRQSQCSDVRYLAVIIQKILGGSSSPRQHGGYQRRSTKPRLVFWEEYIKRCSDQVSAAPTLFHRS